MTKGKSVLEMNERDRWAAATKHFRFLSKLYWNVGESPVMQRDECELGSLRKFFGTDGQRDACHLLIDIGPRLDHSVLRRGLADIYKVPPWALDTLESLDLRGPWFALQGLPKLLRLIACHTRSTAPKTRAALALLVEIEDELAPSIFQMRADPHDAKTLEVLTRIYKEGTLKPYHQGRERICETLVAFAALHGSSPASLAELYAIESLGDWLQLLFAQSLRGNTAPETLVTYPNARFILREAGSDEQDHDGRVCTVTLGRGLIQITPHSLPFLQYTGREISAGCFELDGFLGEAQLRLNHENRANRLTGWERNNRLIGWKSKKGLEIHDQITVLLGEKQQVPQSRVALSNLTATPVDISSKKGRRGGKRIMAI